MAADLRALLELQRRRTQRAQDAFAAAERARQAAEMAAARALQRFHELEGSHTHQREQRIRDILKEPTSAVSLVRIRLQYDMGEDEMRAQANAVLLAREQVKERAEEVKTAKDALNAAMKREKKLEEAVKRLAVGEARIQDVQAEMELER